MLPSSFVPGGVTERAVAQRRPSRRVPGHAGWILEGETAARYSSDPAGDPVKARSAFAGNTAGPDRLVPAAGIDDGRYIQSYMLASSMARQALGPPGSRHDTEL